MNVGWTCWCFDEVVDDFMGNSMKIVWIYECLWEIIWMWLEGFLNVWERGLESEQILEIIFFWWNDNSTYSFAYQNRVGDSV